jgi:hypothetical protein
MGNNKYLSPSALIVCELQHNNLMEGRKVTNHVNEIGSGYAMFYRVLELLGAQLRSGLFALLRYVKFSGNFSKMPR